MGIEASGAGMRDSVRSGKKTLKELEGSLNADHIGKSIFFKPTFLSSYKLLAAQTYPPPVSPSCWRYHAASLHRSRAAAASYLGADEDAHWMGVLPQNLVAENTSRW
ncbi:hypothetical protein KSP40_PGU016134 [Platanthera guangdongensis]|uniref:Uncharacterized protein n=1 Tax=Platanthera guangdongensis TaxID=2320717 RepID=A0ABR2LHI6_9ASPA